MDLSACSLFSLPIFRDEKFWLIWTLFLFCLLPFPLPWTVSLCLPFTHDNRVPHLKKKAFPSVLQSMNRALRLSAALEFVLLHLNTHVSTSAS